MRPLRILIGLTYYLPNISGVTQYGVILAEELVKRKHKVEVICSGDDNQETIARVKVNRVPGFHLGKGFVMPGYPSVSRRLVKNSDVVNCHLPSVESFWLALWAKIYHKKLIVTHHCEFQFSGNAGNFLTALITYPIHFWTYLWADTIIAYTKDYADTSIFLRFFPHKIKYILPPIKVPLSSKKLDFGKGKVVGYVGRIGWEKGLDHLIKAMDKIDAQLVLVGPYKNVVGDKTYEKLKNIISQKVKFIGPIDHDDLKAIYEKLDCLALPSTNNLETFGLVQAEAMVTGCPVVASDLPGVRVPVRMTGMGEISAIGDSNDLAEKINKVLSNGKKHYQKIAKNLEMFDYKKTVSEYEKCFN